MYLFYEEYFKDVSREFDEFQFNTHLCELRLFIYSLIHFTHRLFYVFGYFLFITYLFIHLFIYCYLFTYLIICLFILLVGLWAFLCFSVWRFFFSLLACLLLVRCLMTVFFLQVRRSDCLVEGHGSKAERSRSGRFWWAEAFLVVLSMIGRSEW